ncbi:response regulator [Cupriavidus gilardii]|uniref:response regulator n=1 Tax=Cupriavidus gilardii TaxID=82541 RepID=UPI0021BF39D5|nr:response regulator [Cupriavidus gilardii]MCT9115396.1 response regulator [Cupriavidus gilardii]
MRLLLIEDHQELAAWMVKSLRADGFDIDHVPDGETALSMLQDQPYGLILLDLSLPGIDGLEVRRIARARGIGAPILILTARTEVADRIKGLDLGADDYIAKPFDLGELSARIKAQLRRTHGGQPVTRFGDLAFDSVERAFLLRDEPLTLSRREHAVLEALFIRAGRVVTRESLLGRVFSLDDEVNPEAIELYVSRVRKKLRNGRTTITAVRGIGYLLEAVHGDD